MFGTATDRALKAEQAGSKAGRALVVGSPGPAEASGRFEVLGPELTQRRAYSVSLALEKETNLPNGKTIFKLPL